MSPRIMIVSARRVQHSPMFGQLALSHTVWSCELLDHRAQLEVRRLASAAARGSTRGWRRRGGACSPSTTGRWTRVGHRARPYDAGYADAVLGGSGKPGERSWRRRATAGHDAVARADALRCSRLDVTAVATTARPVSRLGRRRPNTLYRAAWTGCARGAGEQCAAHVIGIGSVGSRRVDRVLPRDGRAGAR